MQSNISDIFCHATLPYIKSEVRLLPYHQTQLILKVRPPTQRAVNLNNFITVAPSTPIWLLFLAKLYFARQENATGNWQRARVVGGVRGRRGTLRQPSERNENKQNPSGSRIRRANKANDEGHTRREKRERAKKNILSIRSVALLFCGFGRKISCKLTWSTHSTTFFFFVFT